MTRRDKAILAGLLTAALVLLGAEWASSREIMFRHKELERDSRIVSAQAAAKISGGLERHRLALEQMASFFENSEQVTEKEFESFARATRRRSPLLLRISHLTPDNRVHWVYPRMGNDSLLGVDIRIHSQFFRTVLRARSSKDAVLSPPMRLLDGPPGFILAVPIFKEQAFLGAVVGTFRSADFFEAMIFSEVTERYDLEVRSGGAILFASGGSGAPDSSLPFHVTEFSLGSEPWQITAQPRPEVARRSLHSGQAALWIPAVILSLLAGGLVGAGSYRTSAIAGKLHCRDEALLETRARLDDAKQQLVQAEKMTALGELVSGVAHEINNPIASIMGYSQLLLARDLPSDVRRRLDIIYSESERMAKMVRSLLAFARKQPPEKKYLGLNGLVEKTLELKSYQFRLERIEVEKDLLPDLPRTHLDFTQIQQVLLNLLNNAEQAVKEAGRAGRVTVITRRSGDRIQLRVQDNGPGVPPEIRSRVFEPFFTTKRDGKGTGLGLSLCYGIVREHGGTIRLEEAAAGGAAFVVELPIIEKPASSAAAATGVEPAPSGSRILVIDPERSMLSLLVDLLTSRGYRVDTASDIPEALAKIASNGHQLIISDVSARGGTGREIYEAVARRDRDLARRIIFTVGEGSGEETRKFIRETGNPIIAKPFKIDDMEKAIAGALRN